MSRDRATSRDRAMTAETGLRPQAQDARPVRGYASGKDDYLRRLRKIEG